MPRGPLTGLYQAPDEKTIRMVVPGTAGSPLPQPCWSTGVEKSPYLPGTARGSAAQALARSQICGVAVDGRTSRGARRRDGTRVHLLGVVEHGGRRLDHLEVDVAETNRTCSPPSTPYPGTPPQPPTSPKALAAAATSDGSPNSYPPRWTCRSPTPARSSSPNEPPPAAATARPTASPPSQSPPPQQIWPHPPTSRPSSEGHWGQEMVHHVHDCRRYRTHPTDALQLLGVTM
jgi:hypothetical protein